jgi:hypothetical protein
MTAPRYQPISSAQIPAVDIVDSACQDSPASSEQRLGIVRVIAGEYAGVKGPATTHTPVQLWDVLLEVEQPVTLPLPHGHTVTQRAPSLPLTSHNLSLSVMLYPGPELSFLFFSFPPRMTLLGELGHTKSDLHKPPEPIELVVVLNNTNLRFRHEEYCLM